MSGHWTFSARWPQQDPLSSEPYMLGLKAARELNDLDGLRWASLGILNQAWTKDQAQVWQSGVGVAKEILQRLQAEKLKKKLRSSKRQWNRRWSAIASWPSIGPATPTWI